MFSTKARLRFGALALASIFAIGSTAWAQTIVVSSSGPSARTYPAGKSLAAGSRIVLAAGDTLTVLDSRGTRVLHGPTTTSAVATAADANPSFAALVATQNRRRARTGAIRGAGEAPKPSNLWYVNVASGGTVCVVDPAAVQLWRPDMQQAATLTVTEDRGPSASASFPIGQNTTAWPTALPIAEGRGYVLSGGGLSAPVRLRFAMLGAPATDPAGTYAALDAKGCTTQKQLLLGALQSPN
jgi:hypothetical protein